MDYEILCIVMMVVWIVTIFGAAWFILKQAAHQKQMELEYVKIIKAQSLSEYTANNAKPPPRTQNYLHDSLEHAARYQAFRTDDEE